jgi:hypothetical protein
VNFREMQPFLTWNLPGGAGGDCQVPKEGISDCTAAGLFDGEKLS